ncbi:MAG TPA: purine-nucleoside phosphorylase [bacterium]|nr:purine-nucleoside phosphorylase [bacterium]
MSIHIGAKQGEFSDFVLMPGDPLRAKLIAETLFEKSVCINQVRGMYGFTGYYKGRKVSVQGSGMGMPSMTIYSTELIKDYGVKTIIRIGTCGCIQEDIKVRDIIMATAASTDSNINNLKFENKNFAPAASFELMNKCYNIAKSENISIKAGTVLTSDIFYEDDKMFWKLWAAYGITAVEMETSALYTVASKYRINALSILTVSDNIITGEATSSEERQTKFLGMAELALKLSL